jgi:cystathionine beta-lyase/cystathionine gamma-synthase
MAGRAETVAAVRAQASILGGCIDPHGAWLLDRGLKTLALRVARQRESAFAIARSLAAHAEVEAVAHPSLDDHPDHELARALLPGGCPLLSFRVRGGDERAVALLGKLSVVRQATSLGGVETLASAPHTPAPRPVGRRAARCRDPGHDPPVGRDRARPGPDRRPDRGARGNPPWRRRDAGLGAAAYALADLDVLLGAALELAA